MSDSDKRKRARPSPPAREVLSSLPSHRPQRVTARRLSTRQNSTNGAAPKRTEPKTTSPRERPRSPKPETAKPAGALLGPRAPRQGFESEEIPAGASIDPPSAPQLLSSALGLAATLAQGALTHGGRLLLGALERLPGV